MFRLRLLVVLGVVALLAGWVSFNGARLTGDQHGGVRLTLAILYALIVLARPKSGRPEAEGPSALMLRVCAVAGMVLCVAGIIVPVHQFEWIGILLLAYGALSWALPARWNRDLILALTLLYWLHPLPGQVFASLQFSMQRWSVIGAEWLLHVLNTRVWADGLMLYNGFQTVGVPEACSGMRTAVTVILSALGIGVLLRMRWYGLLILCVAGIAQVVALNVVRITVTLIAAPKMDAAWADHFLHDTLGSFLLLSILLVQLEASAWKFMSGRRERREQAIQRDEIERPEKALPLPKFWLVVVRKSRIILVVVFLVGLVAYVVFKSRPSHRQAMREEVIPGLITTDIESAERAIDQALSRRADDRELLSRKARVYVLRGKFADALVLFEGLGQLNAFESALKSWCLMAVGRQQEAVALLDGLPESARRLPGVAMMRAEFAAVRGEPEVAAKYVRYAAHSVIGVQRIRALFPFLARHEQWRAIAASDDDRPYTDASHALISAEACLRVNDLAGAGRALRHALKQWPEDVRFLRSLFVLSSRRPGSEWEDLFVASLEKNISRLSKSDMALYLGYCNRLNRADLAWQVYLRLLSVDPRNPDVFYVPAQFGGLWYTFRRQAIGLGARDRFDAIDLKPFVAQTRGLWPMKYLWDRVPLVDDFLKPDVGAIRERYLKWCLAELETREKSGTITERGELIYPAVLALQGRMEEAHQRLDRIAEKYPVFEVEAQLQHAEYYDRQGQWASSYEAMTRYYEKVDFIELRGDFLMVNAMLNLNLGVGALEMATRSKRLFPGVPMMDVLEAAIWDVFGYKDYALFLLSGREDDVSLRIIARLMEETGRRKEAERLNSVLGRQTDRGRIQQSQRLFPEPAERVLAPRWPKPLTSEELRAEAGRIDERARQAEQSPFVSALERLTAEWMRSGAMASRADPAVWAAIGRNGLERAIALHRLAVLLARQQKEAEALAALDRAVELVPSSPVFHRMRIALSRGMPAAVKAARAACPADPEIWLADFVARTDVPGGGKWAEAEVDRVLRRGQIPTETLTRAGDFLLRRKMLPSASKIADATIREGRGYLPAIMLGLRCAIQRKDAVAALSCTRRGIENALDPAIFYDSVVRIKKALAQKDGDMVAALEYLNARATNRLDWAEQLADVYFQQGDMRRALSILQPAIAENLQGVRLRSIILAAEAARLEGEKSTAVQILQTALAMYPDELSVLNNLIYNMALDPQLLPQASALLPRLIEMGSDNFAVLDTIAMVYLRSGQLDLARRYMDRAVSLLDEDNYAAIETRLNAAELMYVLGRYEDACSQILDIRKSARASGIVDIRARRLLDEITIRLQESKQVP